MERTLLQQVLDLPRSDRAAFAIEILRSLDADEEEADEGVEEAWNQEIASRLASLKRGDAELRNWDAVLEEQRSRLMKGRKT